MGQARTAAGPLLQRALEGDRAVTEWMRQFELELRAAAFLSGIVCAADLRAAPRVVFGETRAWIEQLGYA